LKLKCDESLSNIIVNLNLRLYMEGVYKAIGEAAAGTSCITSWTDIGVGVDPPGGARGQLSSTSASA